MDNMMQLLNSSITGSISPPNQLEITSIKKVQVLEQVISLHGSTEPVRGTWPHTHTGHTPTLATHPHWSHTLHLHTSYPSIDRARAGGTQVLQ